MENIITYISHNRTNKLIFVIAVKTSRPLCRLNDCENSDQDTVIRPIVNNNSHKFREKLKNINCKIIVI